MYVINRRGDTCRIADIKEGQIHSWPTNIEPAAEGSRLQNFESRRLELVFLPTTVTAPKFTMAEGQFDLM